MWRPFALDFLKSGSTRSRPGRRPGTPIRKKPAATRLSVERLEDRSMLSFLPAVSYPVGLGVVAEAVGDFNGDAKTEKTRKRNEKKTSSISPGKWGV